MNAAYLRRSVSKDPTKEVSREAQEAACRRMAGAGPLALYVDWGLSGGTAKRPSTSVSGRMWRPAPSAP